VTHRAVGKSPEGSRQPDGQTEHARRVRAPGVSSVHARWDSFIPALTASAADDHRFPMPCGPARAKEYEITASLGSRVRRPITER
jgi:hypothetical protein